MRISINAKTNYPWPWLNVMHIRTLDGKELVLDRDETSPGFWDNKSKICHLSWRGVYQWDGEKAYYDISSQKDIFRGAVLESIEIEEDAPEDYYFEPVSCDMFDFYNDSDFEVISLVIPEPKSKNPEPAHTKMHTLVQKIKKMFGR